jgi:hypothetical protein
VLHAARENVMNVTFVGDSQTSWSDDVVEVTHSIEDRRPVSTVGVRNAASAEVWVPVPLVMPFGDERKNCLRVSGEHELRQRGIHTEFRTDEAGRQVLPYVLLQPGESREWTFDLIECFEGLTTAGEVSAQVTYVSPADTTSHFDDDGNPQQIPCWQGTVELPAIRFRVAY